jgi:Thiopurine S-methyltransferase (TPMT)
MTEYDRNFWEQRWSQALREHGDRVAQRPPNAHLTAEVGELRPGRALDAGCGHGSDALWLAAGGWQVTAVAPGGTLFMVGHRPVDPATGAATAATGQVQVSVEAALAALDPGRWELVVADDRPRPMAGTGVDAVIRARRRS